MKLLRFCMVAMLLSLAALLFTCTAQADSAPFTLTVQPFDDESTKIDWWYSFPENRYYFFLPTGTDTASLRLYYTCDELTINGEKVKNGKKTKLLTANAELTVESGGASYPLTVLCSDRVPAIFIHTASGSLEEIHKDKDYKEAATFTLAENGDLTLVSAPLKHIKGRGNTTWDDSIGKKPYNIRFEEKTDLLGMGAAKKWSLLANYYDETLLRNTIALDAARRMDIPYAVEAKPADLYINGMYLGNYLVCESVQVDPERVNIRDMEKENEAANPGLDLDTVESAHSGEEGVLTRGDRMWSVLPNEPNIENGEYLLELDLPGKILREPAGFFSTRGLCVIVKSPEHATEAQVNRVADIYQAFEDALFSENGKNTEGKSWQDYIDLPSFVNCYLLLEYSMDFDFTNTSFFFTLNEKTGIFKAGPSWDFDITFGNFKDGGLRFLNPYISQVWSINKNETERDSIFYWFMLRPEFREAVNVRWKELHTLFHDTLPEIFVADYYENLASALMNACRWDLLPNQEQSEKARYYERKVWAIWTFLKERADALDRGFEDENALMTLTGFLDKYAANETEELTVIAESEMTMPPDPSPPAAAQEKTTEKTETSSSNKTVWLASSAAGLCLLLLIPLILRRKEKKKQE